MAELPWEWQLRPSTIIFDAPIGIGNLGDPDFSQDKLKQISNALIPHAMKAVAGLYKLFLDSVDRDNDGFSVITVDCNDDDKNIFPGESHRLTIKSFPISVNIQVNPNDVNGNSGGMTPLNLNYQSCDQFTLTAPLTINTWNFQNWLKNGSILNRSNIITEIISSDDFYEAVYSGTCNDSYEDDNDFVQAKLINIGQTITQSICPIGDKDGGGL